VGISQEKLEMEKLVDFLSPVGRVSILNKAVLESMHHAF